MLYPTSIPHLRHISATSPPYLQVLYREIDFDNERQAAEEFAANFNNIKSVKVPAILPPLPVPRTRTPHPYPYSYPYPYPYP